MIQTINPANRSTIETFQYLKSTEIETAIAQSTAAFQLYRKTSVPERKALFARLADETANHKNELAQLISLEMGKPIVESLAEVEKCKLAVRAYLSEFEDWLKPVVMKNKEPHVEVVPLPLGPILAIMPWNFPAWQVYRFAVPTLLMGNTILCKHAPNTFGSARLIEQIFIEAGFPLGVYQNIPIEVAAVEMVIADERVKGVTLTGSGRAGRSVASLSGQHLKRCVLELGGSDPYVILDDADIDLAIAKCVSARMLNGGQSCIAGKRTIVTKKNYQAVVEGMTEELKCYLPGDPLDPSTRLGPIAREDLRAQLHAQVQELKRRGSQIVIGGEIPKDDVGYFYPATLLRDVVMDDFMRQQELFGPVACLIQAQDEEHALKLANSTIYGLGAALFSKDVSRARELAKDRIQAGMVAINGVVRSDPAWPFGGIESSGFGRELTRFGAMEFVNLKTILVDIN